MSIFSSIAVLIPCYNEALTIQQVVRDFKTALPQARIVVFDNASTDTTAQEALRAGAEVIHEPRRGKGNVVRRMFAEIEADLFIMVDGDGTYDAQAAPHLIDKMVAARADMLVATRADVTKDAGRTGHAFGNKIFNALYRRLFGADFSDIFSGYRLFSRRYVKSFPAISGGFEIETEMSVHASDLRLPVLEVELPYGRRPEGSASKLNTFKDGAKILMTFFQLFRHRSPRTFYNAVSLGTLCLAFILAVPLILTYLETGLVPRFPTAILVMGMVVIACVLAGCGLILDNVAAARIEQKRLAYLAFPNPYERRKGQTPPTQEKTDQVDWQRLRFDLKHKRRED